MKFGFFVVVALLSSLAFASAEESTAISRKEIKSVSDAIRHLNAADLSCSKDSDCGTLPMGAALCGGPAGFLVTSRANGFAPAMNILADRLYSMHKAALSTLGGAGLCVLVQAPKVACVSGLCTNPEADPNASAQPEVSFE